MRDHIHDNLPSLAFEAFCAQMHDPFLIVHKSAIHALERFHLPKEYENRAKAALVNWINYYAAERPTDEFLMRATGLYARRYVGRDKMASKLGGCLVAALKKAIPYVAAREIERAGNVYISAPGYGDLLLHVMSDGDAMHSHHEYLIERLSELPPDTVLQKRNQLIALGTKWFLQYRLISGVVIEMLTSSGAWSDAAAFSKSQHDGVENNVRNTQLRLYLALRMIACAFEEAVKAGDASAMETLSKEFQSTLSEIEKDNAANEDRRDPLRGLRRAD